MIKKLRLFICFAAILSFGGQALWAQTSPTAKVTNGRFGTDVDNFISVNDWADVTLSKWFSYLKVANAGEAVPATTLWNDNQWEAGLALKLKTTYLGLSYEGTFNDGLTPLGTYGSSGGPVVDLNAVPNPTISLDGITSTPLNTFFSTATNRIQRNNAFGVLIGAKDAGWKVTLSERISYIYLPYIVDPDGNEGYLLWRNGTITPGLEWGAAKDISIGQLTARPKVRLSLAIGYSSDSTIKLGDVTTTSSYSGNSITPTATFDTGGITVAGGAWGTLKVGADETLTFLVIGSGGGTASGSPWENRIAPYASFSFAPANYFGLGAKLRVPVSFGYDLTRGFVSVGKIDRNPAATVAYYGLLTEDVTSTLDVGVRFAFATGGPLSAITDKVGLTDKLAIHGGIKVHLPSYEFIDVSGARSHGWENATGKEGGTTTNWFQTISLGFSVNIVPNVLLDFEYDINDDVVGLDDLFKNRVLSVMLSAKY
jgi:hypothetical protein